WNSCEFATCSCFAAFVVSGWLECLHLPARMQRQAGSRSIEVLSLAFVFHRKGNCIVSFPPERIVCLTEETVETLYLLGEDDRIVGVSGYAVRPPQVRKEKPRVSAFISADIPKILALK